MAGIRTIEDAIEHVSSQLRILARHARDETNPAKRARLAEAIELGITTKEFLISVKRAHQGAAADARAKKEAERYANYLHRTFTEH